MVTERADAMKSLQGLLAGLMVIAAVGYGAPARAGGTDEPVDEVKQEVPLRLEYLSPEVTPGADRNFVSTAAACGTWQADPDPSWAANTSSYSNGGYEGTGTSCSTYST